MSTGSPKGKPLTLTIDIQVSAGPERLAREVLRFGTDDTYEMARLMESSVILTALGLLIEAQNRQLEVAAPAGA